MVRRHVLVNVEAAVEAAVEAVVAVVAAVEAVEVERVVALPLDCATQVLSYAHIYTVSSTRIVQTYLSNASL